MVRLAGHVQLDPHVQDLYDVSNAEQVYLGCDYWPASGH